MDINTVIDTILNYVEPDDELTAGSDLRLDCGLTSFDMVCLKDELCKISGKTPDDTDIRSCHTVEDLTRLFS